MADTRRWVSLARGINFAFYRVILAISWGLAISMIPGWPRYVFVVVAALHILDVALSTWLGHLEPEQPKVVTQFAPVKLEGEEAAEMTRLLNKIFGPQKVGPTELQ